MKNVLVGCTEILVLFGTLQPAVHFAMTSTHETPVKGTDSLFW
jgi:hypothetical protein